MSKNKVELPKTVVLVGMMGVGKTSIGRKLAKHLDVLFKDSDQEVEKAAGCSVSDIYDFYGEAAFVDAERRVIARLLDEKPHILSTGVGAFVTPENRATIKHKGFSIWLDASYETLISRVNRRTHRPQLEEGDKSENLKQYMEKFTPIYAEADLHISCDNQPPEKTVELIIDALEKNF